MDKLLVTFLTILAIAVPMLAQLPPQRFDPAARARAIAPFIDEQTLAVAHVDLAHVDSDAFLTKAAAIAKTVEGKLAITEEKMKTLGGRHLKRMIKAGAADVYAIFSLADMTANSPFFVVVPLRRGANAEAICTLLRQGPGGPPPDSRKKPKRNRRRPGAEVRVVRGAVVYGAEQVLDRIATMKPHARPELAKAFTTAGDATAQVLILPTADTRLVVEQMIPHLPAAAGGGPTKPFTQGFLWGTVGLNGPPKMSLEVVIQSPNAAAAQDLSRALTGVYAALVRRKNASTFAPRLKEITAILTPKATGDHLTISLDHGGTETLLGGFVPTLRRARMLARRALSASNLRVVGAALYMHTDDHKGAFPENLQMLVAAKMISARTLISPLSGKKSYIYIRPPARKQIAHQGKRLVIYEDPAVHKQKVTTILFADAHTELRPVNKKFWAMVKAAREASEKAFGKASEGKP